MPSTARGPFLNSRTRPSTSIPLSAPAAAERPFARCACASDAAIKPPSRFSDPLQLVDVRCHRYLSNSTVDAVEYHRSQMNAPRTPLAPEPTEPSAKRPLTAALDIG